MRVLRVLAWGFVAWVAYSVVTSRKSRAHSFAPSSAAMPGSNGRRHANGDSTSVVVEWRVRVPENTPARSAVYVCGDHPMLGNWDPRGLRLTREGSSLYRGELHVPSGTLLEYKFTRGSWETVETLPDGILRPNRTLAIRAPELVIAEIEAWSDQD